QEPRQFFPGLHEVSLDLFDETRGAILVRDVRVVLWILARRIPVERLWQGYIRQITPAGGLQARPLVGAGQLEPFAEIAKRNTVALQVMPEGPRFRLFLGMHRAAALPAMDGPQRTFGPGIGVCADKPVMPVGVYLRARIEVITEAPAPCYRVVVG